MAGHLKIDLIPLKLFDNHPQEDEDNSDPD